MPTSDELKAKGNACFQSGDYQGAVSAFTEAIAIDPSNHVLYSNRSASHANLEDFDAALADAEKCVSLEPDWSKGYGRLNAAHFRKTQYDEAIQAAEEGLKRDPDNAQLRSALADARAAKTAREPQGVFAGAGRGMRGGRGGGRGGRKRQSEALLKACQNGDALAAAEHIRGGASVNWYDDQDGHRALHDAAANGHTDVVWLLLDHGANIDAEDNEGCTPLHDACRNGQMAVVKLLIERGADLDVEDEDNVTPRMMAENEGYKDIAAFVASHIDCRYGDRCKKQPYCYFKHAVPLAQGSSPIPERQPSSFVAPSNFSQRRCMYDRWCFNPVCTSMHSPGTAAFREADIARILRPFAQGQDGSMQILLGRRATREQLQSLAERSFHELYMAAKPLGVLIRAGVPDPYNLREKMMQLADGMGRVAEVTPGLASPQEVFATLGLARKFGHRLVKVLVPEPPSTPRPSMADFLNKLEDEAGQDPTILEFIHVIHQMRLYGNTELHTEGPNDPNPPKNELPSHDYDKLLVMCAMTLRAYQLLLSILEKKAK